MASGRAERLSACRTPRSLLEQDVQAEPGEGDQDRRSEQDQRDSGRRVRILRLVGGSARVAIVVAIAFAVSWNPFVKSKTSAVATVSTTIVSMRPAFHLGSARKL